MLTVKPLPAFQDNYIWILQQDNDARIAVVDPGDADPVIEYIEAHGLVLDTILVTHHHKDHTGGLATLADRYGPNIIGPADSSITHLTRTVSDGDTVRLLGRVFDVMATPGHTLDHLSFLAAGTPGLLFCGDTLFCAGCGRLFEGSPEQMHKALQRLAALDDDTLVFAGHEYTRANVAFARAADPDNAALEAYQATCEREREHGRPTLPSTIGREKAINPFLRVHRPEVQRAVATQGTATDSLTTFATMRQWKNNF
ncbi:hydroxyacylglutathione hydrolase [Larsenimonas rhizosphaerae]|uniref:Hydroxyacylglutathione hydrolase n=1 Tax=Larsenimonas rhizosphaerae TaxID=2944682 RepID=A0AA41ZKP7_9GAMM|nr:hydroxyacylglutathione hydrolase [Larsenimonas rhizosphaerae]MCM2130824.1 hydroxyacylglutathione hydrolase [Larsenimonas rhizosphaerae]MCX2523528.1 hydroxyacylglutathione hydrolase [Larsenimonas rhizosphaerae]